MVLFCSGKPSPRKCRATATGVPNCCFRTLLFQRVDRRRYRPLCRKLRVAPLEPLTHKVVGTFYNSVIWRNPAIIVFALNHSWSPTNVSQKLNASQKLVRCPHWNRERQCAGVQLVHHQNKWVTWIGKASQMQGIPDPDNPKQQPHQNFHHGFFATRGGMVTFCPPPYPNVSLSTIIPANETCEIWYSGSSALCTVPSPAVHSLTHDH